MKTLILTFALALCSMAALAEDAPQVFVTASDDGASVTVSVVMTKPSVKGVKAATQACIERAMQALQFARNANARSDAELKADMDKRLKDLCKARATTNLKD